MSVKTMRLDNFLERPDAGHYWCNNCKLWHHHMGKCCRPPVPSPTLSPEAQAVLEAAVAWADRFGDIHFNNHKTDCTLCDIVTAVRAWQATQKPMDYAPDELKPGTRFVWAEGCKGCRQSDGGTLIEAIQQPKNNFMGWRRLWLDPRGMAWTFSDEDRLIPLPEQDG